MMELFIKIAPSYMLDKVINKPLRVQNNPFHSYVLFLYPKCQKIFDFLFSGCTEMWHWRELGQYEKQTQPAITYSKLAIETLEQGKKYVQS